MTDISGVDPSAPPTVPSVVDDALDEFKKKFAESVGNVMAVSKIVNGSLNAEAGSVAEAGLKAAGAIDTTKQGIKQQTQAEIDSSNMEQAAADQLHNDNLTVATANHMTPQQMVDRANRINEIADRLRAENDDISSKAGVTLFTDPGQYFANAFTMPGALKKREADYEALKTEQAILNLQSDATTDAAKVNIGIDAAHGADYAKAKADAIAGKAQQLLGQATLEAAKFQSSNAQVMTSQTEAQMNQSLKLVNVTATALNEAREDVNFELNQGMKSTRIARYKQQLDELTNADKGNLIASAVMGRPVPVSETEAKTMPTNMKASFEDLKNSSLNAAAAAHAHGISIAPAELPVGSTPYDAAQNVKNLGIKMATPSQQGTSNFILDTAAAVANQPAKPGFPQFRTLEPVVKKQMVNDAILGQYDHFYASIPATGSPLSPAPLSKIVSIPLIANTDLGKAMSPMAINPLAPIDFDTLNIQAQKLIDGGKSIPEVAAQLQLIGKQMSAQTNEIRGLSRYNLPTLGSAERPNYNITVHDRAGNAYTVDINNRAAIESSLTRQRINEQFAVDSMNLKPFFANP